MPLMIRIHRNYNLSQASWGGTRCPGCGITIRPCLLIDADLSGTLVKIVCDQVQYKNC